MTFQRITVLAAEDDADLQCVMRDYLEQRGCRLVQALTGGECLEKIEASQPQIILLDLSLPDQDGLALIPQIRKKSPAPLIIVSGRDDTADKIIGLEIGADDYLTKPFEMSELTARIHAILRRTERTAKLLRAKADVQPPKSEKICFNGWTLNRAQYQLFDAAGQSAGLTSGEFKLLEALVMSPNRVLTRERLFEITREGNFDIYDRAIDIQVGRVRKKIGDDPRNPSLIKTIRGIGYIFCGDVWADA